MTSFSTLWGFALVGASVLGRSLFLRPRRATLEQRLAMLPGGLPLEAPLTVRWNDHQVPYVEAETDRDLAVGLGLVHGHLRLTQIELMRRIAEGRLSEFAGPAALEVDRVLRTLELDRAADAMLEGLRDLGLRLDGAAARYVARVELVRAAGSDLPDMSEPALMADLETWLLPALDGVRSAEDWARFDPLPALRARLSWEQQNIVDTRAPARFSTPLGRDVPIDYGPDGPEIAVRLQELFGVTEHPTSGGEPLKITLLSPANRPVQVTRDLPGFWTGSYDDVRKDMRAAYPKHPWPEDPTAAAPTLRAKPKRRPG